MFHCIMMQGFSLKLLKHLVLDEADRLLNMDFEQEIDQILKAIPKVLLYIHQPRQDACSMQVPATPSRFTVLIGNLARQLQLRTESL